MHEACPPAATRRRPPGSDDPRWRLLPPRGNVGSTPPIKEPASGPAWGRCGASTRPPWPSSPAGVVIGDSSAVRPGRQDVDVGLVRMTRVFAARSARPRREASRSVRRRSASASASVRSGRRMPAKGDRPCCRYSASSSSSRLPASLRCSRWSRRTSGLSSSRRSAEREGGRRVANPNGNPATAERIRTRVHGGGCRELASTTRIPITF